ncbi:MAG: hypothetical protein FWG14_06130, partial [Peptococcaceae bacterium]|nr:hypothetical protein [Peptococcaceae bacterium]
MDLRQPLQYRQHDGEQVFRGFCPITGADHVVQGGAPVIGHDIFLQARTGGQRAHGGRQFYFLCSFHDRINATS